MRQFLYSEISAAANVSNIPDDPDLAIEAGKKLCEHILEPLVEQFGPIIVRSGYRSCAVNALGNQKGMGCAPNKDNYGYHIWDRRNAWGHMGAAACIIIPTFNAGETRFKDWQAFAWWLDKTFDHNGIEFFSRDYAFNIGWAEEGNPYIFTTRGGSRYIKKPSRKALPKHKDDEPSGDLFS